MKEDEMGRTLKGAIGVTGLVVGVGLSFGAMTRAADEPPPAPFDQIQDLIPPTEPVDLDVDTAGAEFGEIAALVAASTIEFTDGSKLTGQCGGLAYSYGESGDLIDAAIDFGDDNPPIDLLDGEQAFTSGNPFKVDTRGVVAYYGFMPQEGVGPLNHSWFIDMAGISLDSGGDDNVDGDNRSAGTVDLGEDLPVKFSAKTTIKGELTSDNLAPCIGEGNVEFIGNGLTDPVGIAAMVLLGGGLVGVLFNARPAMTYRK
jgi:hypothetical protein